MLNLESCPKPTTSTAALIVTLRSLYCTMSIAFLPLCHHDKESSERLCPVQSCPGSSITPDSRRRQLLSQHALPSDGTGQASELQFLSGSRQLLQQKNFPFYPNSAQEALAILAITHRGLQAEFSLVHVSTSCCAASVQLCLPSSTAASHRNLVPGHAVCISDVHAHSSWQMLHTQRQLSQPFQSPVNFQIIRNIEMSHMPSSG